MLPLLMMTLFAVPPEAPQGTLVVVGGGSMPEAIVRAAVDLAGGTKARVVVLPQASELPPSEESLERWRKAGVQSAALIELGDPNKAVQAVRAADLIWIGGGDQNRFMKAIQGTGVGDAIRDRHRAGAVVGGTSAGAAVLSQVMITGDADLAAVKAGATKTSDGLALDTRVIFDQHFIARQRFNRLLSAVLDRPQLVGVGIDESTGVIVRGAKFEVVGVGQVMILDARHAHPGAKGGPLSATNVRLHLLKEGMSFQLNDGNNVR